MTGLGEGWRPREVQGTNSFDDMGWGGPCPPPGTGEHEYLVQLHALDRTWTWRQGFDGEEVLPDIEAASIGTVTLVSRFSSQRRATTSTTVGSSILDPTPAPPTHLSPAASRASTTSFMAEHLAPITAHIGHERRDGRPRPSVRRPRRTAG